MATSKKFDELLRKIEKAGRASAATCNPYNNKSAKDRQTLVSAAESEINNEPELDIAFAMADQLVNILRKNCSGVKSRYN